MAIAKDDESTLDELQLVYASDDTVAEMAAKLSMFIGKEGYKDVENYYKKALGSNQGAGVYSPYQSSAQSHNAGKSNSKAPEVDYSQFKD